ncbi:MAG: DUF2203 domain-containing protein [Planctomycetes bacterium]|nr:DUF2203 domain-containing protein [Planctomycetota bacterium]
MKYTIDAANRALPYVRSVIAEVREVYAALQRKGKAHNDLPPREERARTDLKEEIARLAGRVRDCQEELRKIGVEVKDYESGLVDFPAEFEGRVILLCWKDGEEAVGHWHETSDGFRGRQAVPAGQPAWPTT